MKSWSVLIVALFGLAGCQGLQTRGDVSPGGQWNDPAFEVPAGSVLDLKEAAPIPEGTAGVWLQGGKWVERDSDIDHYRPYCRLETWDLVGDEALPPGSFTIWRSFFELKLVRWAIGRQFAQVIPNGQESLSFLVLYRVFMLRSDAHPNVYRMRCGVWENPGDYQGVSLRDVEGAVGDLITIELSSGGAS